jgi:glycosyltransferase involved in cell wall biosynthesis
MKLSIIFCVLESYKVVRRQFLHFSRFIDKYDAEVIFVDDGSIPEINIPFHEKIKVIRTNEDHIKWHNPAARNYGAKNARGEYYYMSDIDHILTEESVAEACAFTGDKLVFRRKYGVLTEKKISTNRDMLLVYGCKEHELNYVGQHANTFVMKAEWFKLLKGYDERFCGSHGGDDVDLNNRYRYLFKKGIADRHVVGKAIIYVFPNPSRDVKKIFHSLRG